MSDPSTRTFTIAHLSDVHLGPIAGFAARYWNAKRALGYLNWQRNRRHAYRRDVLDQLIADLHLQQPDHIAVSGDLINIGLPGEMAQAARWLQSVGPPDRVSVVPGNHDIYTGIGRDIGLARWAAYMSASQASTAAVAGVAAAGFPYLRRLGPVALIGLNSAHETAPFVASGNLGADQRQRLAALLDQLATERVFRLVMIHHPPVPGLTRPSHALTDAEAVRALLARHGAELVIHGHLHRNIAVSIQTAGQLIPVIGVPSASLGVAHPHEPLARYNLYRIRQRADGHTITLTGRGLAAVGGPITELETRELSR
jgi:3',5'-cyclic AMP phosphodiesterase CpdA